ncbi:MAG: DUF2085 domain-containing protein, partial [Planctomycetes bacterium]|nr:DUF2085 domain-containing protein [Planctomycetota bacterium]
MEVIYYIFHGLCHQIPSRELAAGGFRMPMCARCAGMYTGFLVALAAFLVVGRRHRGAPRGAFVGLSCAAFAVFLG